MPHRGKLHCDEDQRSRKRCLKEMLGATDSHLKNAPLTVSTKIKHLHLTASCLLLYRIEGCFCFSVHPVEYTLITWACHSHRFYRLIAWSTEALVWEYKISWGLIKEVRVCNVGL